MGAFNELFNLTPKDIGNGLLNTPVTKIAGVALGLYVLFRVGVALLILVVVFIFLCMANYTKSQDCYVGQPDSDGVIQQHCSYNYPHGFIPKNK